MAKVKQTTTEVVAISSSCWVKKHIFLWSGSSCYGPESVISHVTESSFMGFSGTRRKALELWKSRYVFSPPEVIAQGLVTRLRGHRELQLEQTWESLNVSTSSLHYCSHAITDFSLSKATQRNRI